MFQPPAPSEVAEMDRLRSPNADDVLRYANIDLPLRNQSFQVF